MGKVLLILEVAHKQEYIFGSDKLRENASRSGDIAHVTSSAFFQRAAGQLYTEQENLVYSGGGHAVLQFDGADSARAFAGRVTETAMRQFPGMSMFAKQVPYDGDLSPQENLQRLHTALEKKKALRQSDFRRLSFGVEDASPYKGGSQSRMEIDPPKGWRFPAGFEDLAGDDNFIAVVHIDGNGMGRRVNGLYGQAEQDWQVCRERLRRFSEGIQADFEAAFRAMADMTAAGCGRKDRMLPLRPVILAGDDVCFVTAGDMGLECARIFLEQLAKRVNREDGKPYAACAGVALVHRKYPFHQAYDLAEELCSSAKRYGAQLDPEGRISAMDWHIEFGQLKDSLAALREDYRAEDGGLMTLRPVTVVRPGREDTPDVRSYAFFRTLCLTVQKNTFTRSKIKGLRQALRQGEVESQFYLVANGIQDLRLLPGKAEGGKNGLPRTDASADVFQKLRGERRCLFFDAIEMADHFAPLGGEGR